jgi:hypothetical protein
MRRIPPSEARQLIEMKATPRQLRLLPKSNSDDFMSIHCHDGDYDAESLIVGPR